MKRSDINRVVREAEEVFARHGWALPPRPRWDVTDFGLGDFDAYGLVLINLAEEPEYCEKLMYLRRDQVTPEHYHRKKKEDIICRHGRLAVQLYSEDPTVTARIDGEPAKVYTGEPVVLTSGSRITLVPGVAHAFWADSDYAVVGEVSTANDDVNDNVFADPEVGRFSEIDEDEPALVKLVSD